MRQIKTWFLGGVLAVMLTTMASAADFQKGQDAYDAEDYATALAEFMPLAEARHPKAQFYLGLMYSNGYGVPKNKKEAVRWYRLGAEAGDAQSQRVLGHSYKSGSGVLQDYEEAVKWYRLSAEAGDSYAQYSLGQMYAEGKGVLQDHAEAVKWIILASEDGENFFAQYDLGQKYEKGEGVPKDARFAYMWYSLSAISFINNRLGASARDRIAKRMTPEQIAEAQVMARECFAQNYKNCATPAGDYQKGWEAYKIGKYRAALAEWVPLAEAGEVAAQYNLGQMYIYGRGVKHSYAEAAKWFSLAAETGHRASQYELGVAYDFGNGVPQDYNLAYMWYSLALAQGDERAEKYRDQVAKHMTPAQITEAKRMADKCLAQNYKGC